MDFLIIPLLIILIATVYGFVWLARWFYRDHDLADW